MVVRPRNPASLALVFIGTTIDDVNDCGLILGVGEPTVSVKLIPDCGCDACDHGSAELLEELDEIVLGVLDGSFVHAVSGDRTLMGWRDRLSATGLSQEELEQWATLAGEDPGTAALSSDWMQEWARAARAGENVGRVVSGASWW